jgi:ABC-type Fe3+ transport system substrate-binding protein
MPQPIAQSLTNHDLSSRFQGTSTVVASPSAATETIIASLTLANFGDIPVVSGIRLHGWAAFTAGTNGVSANLKIRETDASGATVASTGAVTVVAANLYQLDALGLDAAPGVVKYVVTLTIGSGSAASTVSAVHLSATII